jgi:hypothetical protein
MTKREGGFENMKITFSIKNPRRKMEKTRRKRIVEAKSQCGNRF